MIFKGICMRGFVTGLPFNNALMENIFKKAIMILQAATAGI